MSGCNRAHSKSQLETVTSRADGSFPLPVRRLLRSGLGTSSKILLPRCNEQT